MSGVTTVIVVFLVVLVAAIILGLAFAWKRLQRIYSGVMAAFHSAIKDLGSWVGL